MSPQIVIRVWRFAALNVLSEFVVLDSWNLLKFVIIIRISDALVYEINIG